MDGFSHYQTSDILRKWTTRVDDGCTWTIEPTGGRTAGCLKRQSTSNQNQPGYLVKSPTVKQGGTWTPQQGGVCGFAIKVQDLARIDNTLISGGVQTTFDSLFAVWHGQYTQFNIIPNTNGTLSVYSGGTDSGHAPLVTTIGALINDTWAYLEFKWLIHKTAGSLAIRVNGIQILDYTGPLYVEFDPGFGQPPELWTSVYCFGIQSTAISPLLLFRVCDFYLSDLSAPDGDFLGDISITVLKPNGVGASSIWTPTPAVNNYLNVNEVPGNDDTSYNNATAIGSLDTYQFEDCNPAMLPIAIQQCILARRTVPGAATITSVVRQGTTNYESPAQAIPNETYFYNCFPYDTNPATGASFTKSDIDGGQFGINKVT